MMALPVTQRRGWTLIYTLVILAVLSALMAIAMQNAAGSRRVLASRVNQLQSRWLARAGTEWAVAKLRTDPNYAGEVLQPIANSRITIRVTKGEQMQIQSHAEFSGIGVTKSHASDAKVAKPTK